MQIGMRGHEYEGCLSFFQYLQADSRKLSDIPKIIDNVFPIHWSVKMQQFMFSLTIEV